MESSTWLRGAELQKLVRVMDVSEDFFNKTSYAFNVSSVWTANGCCVLCGTRVRRTSGLTQGQCDEEAYGVVDAMDIHSHGRVGAAFWMAPECDGSEDPFNANEMSA